MLLHCNTCKQEQAAQLAFLQVPGIYQLLSDYDHQLKALHMSILQLSDWHVIARPLQLHASLRSCLAGVL